MGIGSKREETVCGKHYDRQTKHSVDTLPSIREDRTADAGPYLWRHAVHVQMEGRTLGPDS